VNNLPKVVKQQRRGRAPNPRLLDRKSDALPSHCATQIDHTRLSSSRVKTYLTLNTIVTLNCGLEVTEGH